MRALAHIAKKDPGNAVTRAGGEGNRTVDNVVITEFVGLAQA
jgi:hypothetical protein